MYGIFTEYIQQYFIYFYMRGNDNGTPCYKIYDDEWRLFIKNRTNLI